jgi:hypothetical protein
MLGAMEPRSYDQQKNDSMLQTTGVGFISLDYFSDGIKLKGASNNWLPFRAV